MKDYTHQHTTAPESITVRVVDYGREYIPESINGREVSYLHADDGTVVCVRGQQWGWDLSVTAECWHGSIPRPADKDITWRTKERRPHCTHRAVVRWWADELAGLHRNEAQA